LASLQGVLVKIQSQVTLPLLSVRSVALEAMLRENRSDIAIEGKRIGGGLGLGRAPIADPDHGESKAESSSEGNEQFHTNSDDTTLPRRESSSLAF
jgi:hypothetical protein